MHPEPVLIIPKVAPLTIPLMLKSLEVVPSSATKKVRVAFKDTGQDITAPRAPVPALFTVTLPPKLSTPVPEIVAAIVAPQKSTMLVGDVVAPSVKLDNAKVAPALTVSVLLKLVFALRLLVLFPVTVKL
jgi:hypothetical protein